jgi:hypothetical protein
MRAKLTTVLLGMIAISLTSCSNPAQSGVYEGTYEMSTKCGIQFLYFGEEWFETKPALGDGEAPNGWPSPTASGKINWEKVPGSVVFTSQYRPSSIVFEPSMNSPRPGCE